MTDEHLPSGRRDAPWLAWVDELPSITMPGDARRRRESVPMFLPSWSSVSDPPLKDIQACPSFPATPACPMVVGR